MFPTRHVMWFCLVLLFENVIAEMTSFDEAYFYATDTKDLGCENKLVQLACIKTCGSSFSCSYGKCYCDETKGNRYSDDLENIFDDIQKFVYLYHLNNQKHKKALKTPKPFVDSTLRTEESPALRHHIAHFCPNLGEARKCIKRCMTLGKPAFCGKDHVCYCGHRYINSGPDKPVNVNDMYAQFRDLYEKYFGPNIAEIKDK